MTEIKNVVVVGATGNSGPALVREILASKKYNVFALARLESKSVIPPPVEVIKTDFSNDSLAKIFTPNRFDAIISLLNVIDPVGYEAEVNLINAAAASGVKRYIPSGFGADNSDPKVIEHVPAFRKKNDITDLLKKLQSEGSGLSWTGVACGPFFDWALKISYKFANVDFKELKFTVYDDGNAHHHTTTLSTIGRAIANLLGDEAKLAATSNRYIFIGSYELTQNQLFGAVERIWKETGRKGTWTREYQTSEGAAEKAGEKLAQGDFAGIVDQVKIAAYGKAEATYWPGKLDNELLDLPAANLVADIKAVLDELVPLK